MRTVLRLRLISEKIDLGQIRTHDTLSISFDPRRTHLLYRIFHGVEILVGLFWSQFVIFGEIFFLKGEHLTRETNLSFSKQALVKFSCLEACNKTLLIFIKRESKKICKSIKAKLMFKKVPQLEIFLKNFYSIQPPKIM